MSFLSISDIALDLEAFGISRRAVQMWVQSGKLPAIRVGNRYRVAQEDYLRFKSTSVADVVPEPTVPDELGVLVEDWLTSLTMGHRPFSPRTVSNYRKDLTVYLKRLSRVIADAFDAPTATDPKVLAKVIEGIPRDQFVTRYHAFCAVLSFTKFLVGREMVPADRIAALKAMRPKRYLPPRRTVLTLDELHRFFNAVWLRQTTRYEKVFQTAMLKMLVYTGLRNQELCDLRLDDVDLAERIVTVRLGKGAKPRKVGIVAHLVQPLEEYLALRPPGEFFFMNEKGQRMSIERVGKRVQRVAKVARVDVTPHGLRRTFATVMADAGKPVTIIQRALGHNHLSTTELYLMTSENEVLRQMRDW